MVQNASIRSRFDACQRQMIVVKNIPSIWSVESYHTPPCRVLLIAQAVLQLQVELLSASSMCTLLAAKSEVE